MRKRTTLSFRLSSTNTNQHHAFWKRKAQRRQRGKVALPALHSDRHSQLPSIAFGTGSALYGRDATDYVEQALENGFSHIDTAQSKPPAAALPR